jgi:hypothetical protein
MNLFLPYVRKNKLDRFDAVSYGLARSRVQAYTRLVWPGKVSQPICRHVAQGRAMESAKWEITDANAPPVS